jgi:hypothetical protein
VAIALVDNGDHYKGVSQIAPIAITIRDRGANPQAQIDFVQGVQLDQYEPYTTEKPNHRFDLSYIEFDEKGDYWDRRQLGWTVQAIKRTAGTRDVVLVVYCMAGKTTRATSVGTMSGSSIACSNISPRRIRIGIASLVSMWDGGGNRFRAATACFGKDRSWIQSQKGFSSSRTSCPFTAEKMRRRARPICQSQKRFSSPSLRHAKRRGKAAINQGRFS